MSTHATFIHRGNLLGGLFEEVQYTHSYNSKFCTDMMRSKQGNAWCVDVTKFMDALSCQFGINAAIYTRVSTVQQKYGSGINRQIETCLEFCKDHEINAVDVYYDLVSGTECSRPGIDILVCNKCKYDVVLVEAGDRFARSVEASRYLRDRLADLPIVYTSTIAVELEEKLKELIRMYM